MSELHDPSGEPRAGASAVGPHAFLNALCEMVPVPVIVFDAEGRIIISNRLASQLLVVSPEYLDRRILTFDGTDLWEIIAGERQQGELLLTELPVRIRTAGSRHADLTFIVSTLGGVAGQAGGVLVMAYDAPDERDLVGQHPHPLDATLSAQRQEFGSIIRLLAEDLGADAAVFAEIDPDRPLSARTIAIVQDGQPLDGYGWSLPGTPVMSTAGKRSVIVTSGLRDAFPDDTWAAAEGFESFAAVFLTDVDGRRAGVLAAYSRDPMETPDATVGMLRLFAARLQPSLRHIISDRTLRESEERYSAIFERSHLPMLLVDPASTQIVDANQAACAFYGFDYDDFTAMSVLQVNTLAPDDTREELTRAAGGTRNYFQFHHRLADGSVRDVEVYSNPISVHSRELLSEIIHDVTERRRTESDLERYKQQLERLLQRRTDDLIRSNVELQRTTAVSEAFYENVGAEFRTPLHTILGFSDLLARGMVGDLTEEQARQVGMIQDAGRTLAALMDDVLELSRLDTGIEVCEPERFDVAELVRSVALGVLPAAEAKGLALEVTTPPAPVEVYTDRNKAEQILLQLMSNALKYTAEGFIGIEVIEPDIASVWIRVADSGAGIDREELSHIFEEFRQVARDAAGTHEGTGLGLALCKRLAGILGGTIDVESDPGGGSVFTLSFPTQCVTTG